MNKEIIISGNVEGYVKWKIYKDGVRTVLDVYTDELWDEDDKYDFEFSTAPWEGHFFDTVIHRGGVPTTSTIFKSHAKDVKYASLCEHSFLHNELFGSDFKIKELTFLEGVTKIPRYKFNGNSSIKKLILPESLQFIEDYTCRNLKGLKEIHISSMDAWCNLVIYDNNPLSSAHNLYLNGELVREVDFSTKVNFVRPRAFQGGECIEKVHLHENIRYIDNMAFDGCTNLVSINIPAKVTQIGMYAFSNCAKLEKLVFPANLEKIDHTAFYGCTSLKSVTFLGELPKMEKDIFSNCPIEEIITPKGKVSSFKELPTLDYLCKKECDPKQRKLCALLRSARTIFEVCSSHKLVLEGYQGKTRLAFKVRLNESDVYEENTRPYREYQEYIYYWYVPSNLSLDEAFDYALNHFEDYMLAYDNVTSYTI